MSPRELIGMGMRDLPAPYRRAAYVLGAALLVYQAAPLVAAVVQAPAGVQNLTVRVDVMERRLERDSARQERMLCMQEVQVGIRPELDLTTRCAQ
jgi:hypothetical protein